MRQGDTLPQVSGATRYLYHCPRGTIAIDEHPNGRREVMRTTNASAATSRDVRDAVRMHEDALAAEREDGMHGWDASL